MIDVHHSWHSQRMMIWFHHQACPETSSYSYTLPVSSCGGVLGVRTRISSVSEVRKKTNLFVQKSYETFLSLLKIFIYLFRILQTTNRSLIVLSCTDFFLTYFVRVQYFENFIFISAACMKIREIHTLSAKRLIIIFIMARFSNS